MTSTAELHPREREIMEAVWARGEASVADVLRALPSPPSYSTIRAMMGRLEGKGFLTHRVEGNRYLYRPAHAREEARDSALARLLRTFFDGSPTKAMAAILDRSATELSDEELDEMAALIESARSRGR